MGRKVRIESDDVLIIHTAPIFQPLLAPASYKGSGSRNAPHSDAAPQPTPSSPHISHIDLPTFSLPQKKLDRDFKERGPRAEPLIPIAAIPPPARRLGLLRNFAASSASTACRFVGSLVGTAGELADCPAISIGDGGHSATWPFSSRRSVFGQSTRARARPLSLLCL